MKKIRVYLVIIQVTQTFVTFGWKELAYDHVHYQLDSDGVSAPLEWVIPIVATALVTVMVSWSDL